MIAHMTRVWSELLNVLLIVLGVLCATMGLHGFLFSSNFIDGGVTGISMLLAKTTSMPLSVWLPVINLPFIALGYRRPPHQQAKQHPQGRRHHPDVQRAPVRHRDDGARRGAGVVFDPDLHRG